MISGFSAGMNAVAELIVRNGISETYKVYNSGSQVVFQNCTKLDFVGREKGTFLPVPGRQGHINDDDIKSIGTGFFDQRPELIKLLFLQNSLRLSHEFCQLVHLLVRRDQAGFGGRLRSNRRG